MTESVLPIPLNCLGTRDQINTLREKGDHTNIASLPVDNPTTSFWQTETLDESFTLNDDKSSREWDNDADICIIGSGITGVSAAYHLSRLFAQSESLPADKAIKAVILDAREFCNGATGRNGGHLTAFGYDGFASREIKYGREDALRQVYLEEYTVNEVLKLIKDQRLEEAVDLVSGGFVYLFFTEEEENAARADIAAAEEAGLHIENIEWLTKEQVQKEYGAEYPGLRLPGNNLWPRKFVEALYTIAQRTTPNFALSIHTLTPVTSITAIHPASDRRWIVNTPRGTITSSYILHATNAYASHLLPHLQGPEGIIPGRGQIIATRAAADLSRTAFGANDGFEYWFPRPIKTGIDEHPLVIVGGGREASTTYELYETDDSKLNPDISRRMRRFLPSVFPHKFDEEREPEMEWSGIMGFTKSGDPFVGPVVDPNANSSSQHEGQYICAGFSGHGMPRAFACAEVVAGMIASSITHQHWTPPNWIPLHYLTPHHPQ